MSIAAQAPAYIRAISPYVPGKPITELAREMGLAVESIVKLASNENPLGMSPKARAAVEKAIAGIERYPDQFELIAALAERLGVGTEQIVLGNGSNDVLDLAARVFLAPGRSSVFSQHAFAVYPLATHERRRRVHRRAGESTTATTSTPCARRSVRTPAWSGSPTRTIRPATSCPTPR